MGSYQIGKVGNWGRLFFLALFLAVALFGAGMGAEQLRSWGEDGGSVVQSAEAAAPSAPVWGGALGTMGEPGAWNCDTERRWVFGPRWGTGSADYGSLGTALPDRPDNNYAVNVTSFVRDRFYRVTLFSAKYGDITVDYPYDAIDTEGGFSYPTGRYDPLGRPSVFFNGNLLKFTTGVWGGGGSNADWTGRVYIFCRINP